MSLAEMSLASSPSRARQPSALHITSQAEITSAPKGSSLARSLIDIRSDIRRFSRYGIGVYFVKPPGNHPPNSSTKP